MMNLAKPLSKLTVKILKVEATYLTAQFSCGFKNYGFLCFNYRCISLAPKVCN